MTTNTLFSKKEEFDYGLAAIHLFVALIFGLLFVNSGELIKFVLLPYIALTLYYPKKEALPGLTLLMCYGTILTICGSLIILVISLTKINEIKLKRLLPLWLMLICSFPVYAYNTITRIFEFNYTLVDSLVLNDYYYAFWFLLFGALNPQLVSKKSISFILFVTIIIIVFGRANISALSGLSSLFRLISVSEIIILLFLYLIFTKTIPLLDDIYVRLSLVIFILTRTLLGLPQYTFTFYLGLLIGLSFVFQKEFFLQKYNTIKTEKTLKLRSSFFVILPFPFLIITMIITPLYAVQYEFVDMSDYYFEGQTVFDAIMAKLFVDRGLLWIGAVEGVMNYTTLLPPMEEWFISFNNIKDISLKANFEAHSLFIELIRKNGYIMGGLLSVTYLHWQYKLIKSSKGQDPYLNVFRYAIFGVAIAVFMTGQYTLMLTTSFYFMLITGALVNATNEDAKEEVGTPPKIKNIFNGT